MVKKLDSGFRRNDKFYGIATSYEFIYIEFFRSIKEGREGVTSGE